MSALSLAAAAAEQPDGLALIAADGRRWTWSELRAEADRIEHPGGAFEAAFRPATVIRILAAIDRGAPFAPLDPGLPAGAIRARHALLKEIEAERATALALLFTSGSTGSPRGVELSRDAFLASAAASARRLGWREDDRWLCVLPLAHVGGLSIPVRCLAARRTIVLADRFDATAVADLIEREAVTLASFVPTQLARLLEPDVAWTPPARLRAVLLGGAAASEALWNEALDRGVPALETWGMTEACSQVATAIPGGDPRAPMPLEGWEVRARDGRLEVRGPALFTGYRGAGETDPILDGEGWFRTGDAGRVEPDGSITVLGRADETIVTGGRNVAPAEIERFLETLPGIRRAVVVGLPDEEWGETIAAALEARPDAGELAEDREAELERRLREGLAPWQRPRTILWMDRLPETVSGKIDRTAVRRACHSGLTARRIRP